MYKEKLLINGKIKIKRGHKKETEENRKMINVLIMNSK